MVMLVPSVLRCFVGYSSCSITDQVVFGTVLGALLGQRSCFDHLINLIAITFFIYFNAGLLFSKLMRISHNKGFIDHESYIAQYLALSIFTIGVASTLGADDLLAAFAAGLYPV